MRPIPPQAGGRVSRKILSSSWLGVLLLGLVLACGSRTRRNTNEGAAANPNQGAAADFCDDLASRLAACGSLVELDLAKCRDVDASAANGALDRARACLDGSCQDLGACVNGELGSIIPNAGGVGGSGSGGAAGLACPGSAVRCLDAATAEYCEGSTPRTVICSAAMAEQGIVSSGCRSDDLGDGCTVDAFLDQDCEAGTPAFAVCEALTEGDLVTTYTACFQNLSGASDVIPCYRDFVDTTGVTVDCAAAQVSCAIPGI
ncbi:MAG TPA: hypothetical protein VJN18_23945 [Polyangiaceae bacterium]|nr:hypothetical protein [Polyangiaceae bacterium]